MGEITKSRQKNDKDMIWYWYDKKWPLSERYCNFDPEIINFFVFQMWSVIILRIILWSFYIQNINFIAFFTQNIDLHNIISIWHQFDSKIFSFISFFSTKLLFWYHFEYKNWAKL